MWRLAYGRELPPRLFRLRKMNRALGPRMNVLVPELRITDRPHIARFSPWQIIVGTLTAMYASRNLDKLLGLGGTHAHCSYSILTQSSHTFLHVRGESAPEPLADLVRATSLITIQNRVVINSNWPSTHHPISEQHGLPRGWTPVSQLQWLSGQSGYEIYAQSYSQATTLSTPTRRMRRFESAY